MKSKRDPKLAAWGKAVLERDNHSCRWPHRPYESACGSGDERIDPHHIAPRSRRPDLKYELSNGIALCRTHHDWVGNNPIEAEKIGLNSFETYEAARKVAT